MAFPRENRISGKKVFQKIISTGKTVQNSFFFVYYLKNNFHYSRFSIVISSKAVPKAVERNRIRRRASETIRRNFLFIYPGVDPERSREGSQRASASYGIDIIIITRPKVKDLGSSELERSLIEIFKKAKIFFKKT